MADAPTEPPPSVWRLPDPRMPGGDAGDDDTIGPDLIALGGDLEPGTLLAAYRLGLFPMHVRTPPELSTLDPTHDPTTHHQTPPTQRIGWWSPDPRGVIELDQLRVSRSLRQALRRYSCTVNQDFEQVVASCANRDRAGGWINDDISSAYLQLHRLGWAHSIEAWELVSGAPGKRKLVGGLYGVAIGGLFAGESMFHTARDASKVALVHLTRLLTSAGQASERLLDVQWATEHLVSLGAGDIPRREYLGRLDVALKVPLPAELLGARSDL